MAGMKDGGKGLASLMFEEPSDTGTGDAPPDEPDNTDEAYTETVTGLLEAVASKDVEAAKTHLRDAVHFASLLGPSDMAEEPAGEEA